MTAQVVSFSFCIQSSILKTWCAEWIISRELQPIVWLPDASSCMVHVGECLIHALHFRSMFVFLKIVWSHTTRFWMFSGFWASNIGWDSKSSPWNCISRAKTSKDLPTLCISFGPARSCSKKLGKLLPLNRSLLFAQVWSLGAKERQPLKAETAAARERLDMGVLSSPCCYPAAKADWLQSGQSSK